MGTTLTYHIQQEMLIEDSCKVTTDISVKVPETCEIKVYNTLLDKETQLVKALAKRRREHRISNVRENSLIIARPLQVVYK